MVNDDTLSHQQQLQQQIMMKARQQQMQIMAAQRQQQAMGSSNIDSNTPFQSQPQPQSRTMGSFHDDLPINDINDLNIIGPFSSFIGQKPVSFENFESTCRNGPLSAVQSIVSSEARTPAFLHHGLIIALKAGNIDVVRYLLSTGAPIVRQTPSNILSAPLDQQIPLFELLAHHGWTPNTRDYDGAVLLPRVVDNLPLLSWFLAHGANPNLGVQRDNRDRAGGPVTDSCAALESAASHGDVEAVCMLLDAGAEIQNGVPLHYAAGVCPPGTNPHVIRVVPTKEFDSGRIPVMALLVERGADVNKKEESHHMVPCYAIVRAVMAGAVERVRWLLENGADPGAKGAFGNAAEYARAMGSEEMRRVVEEGVAARKWAKNDNFTEIEATT